MRCSEIRRRDVLVVLRGVAAWPLAARAQQSSRVWRMGFIARGHETFYDALFDGLQKLGYSEGRNLIVEGRMLLIRPSVSTSLRRRWFD
jgi:putative tryptophan/tyrosine transport system substrate-binding protein